MTNSTPNLTRLRELKKKVANLQTVVLLLFLGFLFGFFVLGPILAGIAGMIHG